MPKNIYGYAPTTSQPADKTHRDEVTNAYIGIGAKFMNDYARIKNVELPQIRPREYYNIGLMVYKYQNNKLSNRSNKKDLQSMINVLLSSNVLPNSLAQDNSIDGPRYELSYKDMNKRLQEEIDTSRLNRRDIIDAEKDMESNNVRDPMKEAEELLNSKRDAVNEKQSDNRLGGSSFAYKQNYRPVDPRIQPQPYDSIWG